MVTNDECRGCGAAVPKRSRFCPRCGRSVDTPLLDLERLDGPTAGAVPAGTGQPVQRAVAEQRGLGWSARSVAAALAVVVLLVGLVAVVAGGDDDDSAVPAATPSTTGRSDTTRAPRTTTTTPPAPSVLFDAATLAPLLDSPRVGGLSLYVSGGRDIGRVELDTGRITVASRIFLRTESSQSLLVAEGQLIAAREGGVYTVAADLTGKPELIPDVDGWNLRANSGAHLLGIEYPGSIGQPVVARRVGFDGTVEATWLLGTNTWPAGFLGDRIVTQGGGRIYTIGSEDDVEPYANGEVILADGRFVLWRECDDAMECTLRVGDAEQPRLRVLQPDVDPFAGGVLLIAPDGLSAVVDGGLQPLRLVDLRSGATIEVLDLRTVPAWSPDGSWLFTRAGRETLLAISTRGEAPIEFPLPAGDYGSQDLVLAVG